MKALIGILALVCFVSLESKAQSLQPAKVHFLNLVVGTNAEVKTTFDEKKPILLKARTWVVVQTAGDSLGLVVDGKSHTIHFESGKQYYFVIQTSYGSRPVMTEKSEREFVLTATINSVKGPEEYSQTKVIN